MPGGLPSGGYAPLVPFAAAGGLHGQQRVGNLDMDAAMSKPTKFGIMRRNRRKLAKARKTLRERIDDLEREICAEWDELVVIEKDLADIQDQFARSRECQLPRQSAPRRLLNWSMGMRVSA
jgi:septal ring factor EnvC (AmiA/AmiB activator)